jgi:hypothetical protein
MIPKKIMDLIEQTRDDHKEAAFNWFNECDLTDLQRDRVVTVENERVDSFMKYAREKGVQPSLGLGTFDGKCRCLFLV